MAHLAFLDIIRDPVLKVIQASEDLVAYLEDKVQVVKTDFQDLQDKKENHIPTTFLG